LLASSRGGECLSTEYLRASAPLVWRCSQGHKWSASWNAVRSGGTWCPTCARSRISIRDAQLLASSRGGECLSTEYLHSVVPLHWRCAQGHEWSASWNVVRSGGSWCPTCARSRITLRDAQELALSRGGHCLSTEYQRCTAHLHWRCAQDHEWYASWKQVKHRSSWCPDCRLYKCEGRVRQIFENIFLGHRFLRCRPNFLRGESGRCLELDGFCEALQLAFEFNGIQHYEEACFFNRRAGALEATLARDRMKSATCSRVGVRLVVVPYCVRDRLTYVRTALLRWFAISSIFRVALSA